MKSYQTVYVYRYDAKKEAWSKQKIDRVLVSGTMHACALGDVPKRDAHLTLRVMSDKHFDVLPEDVLAFSEGIGDAPPDAHAVVVSVTENHRGGKRVCHTKIVCR